MVADREIRQGEVWRVRLDPGAKPDQATNRPVLIVSVDQINRASARLSIVCPITTTPSDAAVRVELGGGEKRRIGYVEPYQVRTLSHARLTDKVGAAPDEVCREVSARIELFTRFRR